MHPDIEQILVSEAEIRETVAGLGAQISRDYAGKDILAIIILKGSVVFAADLIREIQVPVQIDFMQASSYGASTESQGVIHIRHDLSTDIAGRHVLLIEDIIDSGNTLFKLREMLQARGPASLRICTMLNKPSRRTSPVEVEYIGKEIPDAFVVGYGLDYNELHRGLPYIGVLKPSVYTK